MRRTWMGIRLAFCLLLAATGCISLSPQKKLIKAPPLVEEYNVPPDDKRYSNPPEYPKNVLNKDHKMNDLDEKEGLDKKGSMNRLNGSNMSAGY
jgi:hypothetical protein